jgi:hypothetical protein
MAILSTSVRQNRSRAVGTTVPGRHALCSDSQEARIGDMCRVQTPVVVTEAGALEPAQIEAIAHVEGSNTAPTRLMPLLSSLESRPPMTTIVGTDRRGAPLVLNLLSDCTWHVSVEGVRGAARSEWLRCALAGLVLGCRPSELQLLGIDLTGGQLAFIEALPHALTDVAFRPDDAIDLLSWLRDEADRRQTRSQCKPHIILAVDDLMDLAVRVGRVATSLINQLINSGPHSGIHLIVGWDGGAARVEDTIRWGSWSVHVVCTPAERLPDCVGIFKESEGGCRSPVRAVSLPVVDLDSLVRQALAAHAGTAK